MSYDHISDFDYELPEQLIAQHPLAERSASRLMSLNVSHQAISHSYFTDIVNSIMSNDLLIVNNTKVFPARLYGSKSTGGQIECLVERVLSNKTALAHIKSSKSPKQNGRLYFSDSLTAIVIERVGDLFLLKFECDTTLFDALQKIGHIPLPSYIDRVATEEDKERYQTVYAEHLGAVAAPTAGLHFTSDLLSQLKSRGVQIAQITLHVGAGTFQPLRVEKLDAHQMHNEYLEVSKTTCEAIQACRRNGGRVIAVGTTTLRALETATHDKITQPFTGNTDLFIRPGYQFQSVDALITNFHLPKSSLLMLVTAFGGYDLVMQAYREAIHNAYRFYSYGDAMFIYGRDLNSNYSDVD